MFIQVLTALVIFGAAPAYARDARCEEILAPRRPSSESILRTLRNKVGLTIRPMEKKYIRLMTASYEWDETVGHIMRFVRSFKWLPKTKQLGITLHETVHLTTSRKFEKPVYTDVDRARMSEVEGTRVSSYEAYYSFDELEARIREIAVYVQAAEKKRMGTAAAVATRAELEEQLWLQRLIIEDALHAIETKEAKVVRDLDANWLRIKMNHCPGRYFCKLSIPARAVSKLSDSEAIEDALTILKVRLKSLDAHQTAIHKFFKRLDKLTIPALPQISQN